MQAISKKADACRSDHFLREKLGLSQHAKIFVCVGRLSEQKGQRILFQALSTSSQLSDSVQVVLVGDGEDCRALQQETRNFGAKIVKFVGYREDVIPYLAAADCFVLPSLAEGLPGALIEAMAAGLPCIATDIPGTRELIRHEHNGLLVPPQDPSALAAAMSRIVSNPTWASQLGARAYEFILREYDISAEAASWDRLFAEMDVNLPCLL